MAAIDKTYVKSYKEYNEFKEWAKDKVITFFDGLTRNVKDFIYEWQEEDFIAGEIYKNECIYVETDSDNIYYYIKDIDWDNDIVLLIYEEDGVEKPLKMSIQEVQKIKQDCYELPVINSPTYLDIFLVQNCPIKFIQNRMKEVYHKDFYNKMKEIDLSAKPPKELQQNRKITVTKNDKYTKFPIHNKPYGKVKNWWLQSNNYIWFNSETNTWVDEIYWYYPVNTNTAHFKSLKAVIRHLRKQYLPTGISFILSGRYVGEEYLIKIK